MIPRTFTPRQERRLRAFTTATLSNALIREHRRLHPPAPPPPAAPTPEPQPPPLPGFGVDLGKHLPPHSRH